MTLGAVYQNTIDKYATPSVCSYLETVLQKIEHMTKRIL